MNVIRFSDLVAQGQVQGRRVFIRADLNVPLDDAGRITEDTRVRASLPCIRMALDAGAAVMVTSHLGRPTEGEFSAENNRWEFEAAEASFDLLVKKILGQYQPRFERLHYRVNIETGEASERNMTTGRHVVRDIMCRSCGDVVGWKYDKAYETSEKYKEGKFILEAELLCTVS